MTEAIERLKVQLISDSKEFKDDFDKVIRLVDRLKSTLESLNTVKNLTVFEVLDDTLNEVTKAIQRLNVESKKLSQFSSLANGINKLSNGLKTLSSDSVSVSSAISRLKSFFDQLSNESIQLKTNLLTVESSEARVKSQTTNLSTQLSEVTSDFTSLNNKLNPLDNNLKDTANSTQQLSEKSREASTNVDTFSRELGEANTKLASIDKSAKSTSKSLGFLGYALRNAFSNAFNRVTSEISKAITETYKAKSEMQSWFNVMGLSSSEVASFNQHLDETVSQFQRVNKYGMGETIASLGVEFQLTEKQMEKAMRTTAMVTNEYLRAGRSTEEANLAIKDILQGQFQRLSRETGVGKEDLIEAGWDEDLTNVNGILDALDKIAVSRHWDTIAQKASSINDIILIGQNRISEWVSEVIDRFTPTITGLFNAFMDVFGYVQSGVNGVMDWLGGDGLGQIVVKWSGLATVIGVVSTALVHYRTDATLSQIAQMGLKDTIASTILGLNAETVALHGVDNALKSRLLGLDAEKVKELRVRDAILTKILGLKAEEVAEKGLLNTIKNSIETKKLQQITDKAQSVISRDKSIALVGEATAIELVKDKETQSILVKEGYTIATGEQSGASLGFVGALKLMIFGEVEAEATTLSLSGAIAVLTAEMLMNPITWFIGALGLLAGAFYVATGGLDEHWSKMKGYHETLENSEEVIKSHTDYLKRLGEEVGTDSELYKQATDNVKAFNEELGHAKAYEKVLSDKESSLGIDVKSRADLNSKYAGLSSDTAKALGEDIDNMSYGLDNANRSLQVWNKQLDDYDKSDRTLIKNMQDRGAEEEDILNKRQQHSEHYMNFIQHSKEHNTSDDWWGGTWAGILAGVDSFQLYLDYKTEDLANWWNDVNKEFGKLPQGLDEALKNIKFPDIGKMWNDWIADSQKSLSDSWQDITEMWDNNIKKPIMDAWNGFWSFEWLNSDGGDATGSKTFDIVSMIKNLFGFTEGVDVSWVFEFINDNIITPISNTLQNFMADPVAFIGNMGFTISGLLDGLFGTDIFTNVMTWVNNSIITPFGTAIYNGIMQIPILSDILILLGFTDEAHGTSEQKGRALANAFGTMLCQTIGNIPILGDLLRLLGVIDSQQPNARGKGQSFGGAIYDGLKAGIGNMVSWAIQEFQDIANGIRDKVGEAYNSAKEFGSNLWNGLNSVMKRASPGFMHDEVLAEFGTDIPNAISSSGDVAYTNAQYYGQQIRDGVASATQTNLGLDTMVGDYESDAQNIAMSSEMMGTTTTTAFNDMTMSVNASTNQMQSNVVGTYSQIQTQQGSSLNSMKTQNIQAYNDMYLKSNQSLIQMRDSTTNVTHQMTQAWTHMKDQIVSTANRLKTDSTNHFNQLSSTIGTFYGKIQNPSRWGAGTGSSNNVRTARNPIGRNIARTFTRHGAGSRGDKYRGASTMTVAQAKKMFCPNGDCANIFDGYSLSDTIDIKEFLANINGEHGFGWNGWNVPHYNHIKTKSDAWSMKSPMINLAGGIPTNANFKVGEFNNGTPKVSFSTFQSIAGSIFSAIPYKHYMDSSWKGSWLGALQSGACNCSDGADALIALASVFGFGGSKQWGTWDGEGHFWAVINGVPMDTTAWQKGYGWTSPKVHGYGSPARSGNNDSGKTVNVTVDMQGATIYGVDDLDSRIQDSVQKGLQAEFNDPYTITI